MKHLSALLLVLLLTFPISFAASETLEELTHSGVCLTESQEWWLETLEVIAPLWDRLQLVELPDQSWFRVYALPENVYALFEYKQSEGVISYLIIGEESALLWDTGLGIGNIRSCVEKLTDLPITVLNSHEHFDHIGGNAQFDRVMCYNDEHTIKTLTQGISHEEKIGYIIPEEIVEPPEDFSEDTFFTAGKAPTATVEDGQVIDLGGRQLEVMYTPGHTDVSIILIDEKNSLLFTGDTWYPGLLYGLYENSVSDYVESMHRIERVMKEKNIRQVYGSHNAILPGNEMIHETTVFFEDILNGKVDYEEISGFRYYSLNERLSFILRMPDADISFLISSDMVE